MNRAGDLDAAIRFVIDRIEGEAMRSGEPLDEHERHLLNNLPKSPTREEITSGDPTFPTSFQLRDITYERICALAKAARRNDVALNPTLPDWDFAFCVAKVNKHPMSWLLKWAGVKQRRPWWDRWFLVVAALFYVAVTMLLLFFVVDKPLALWRWVVVGGGYVGIVLCMKFVSRRIERKQLERNIEQIRNACGFVRAAAR
jgi:hypothetical protein